MFELRVPSPLRMLFLLVTSVGSSRGLVSRYSIKAARAFVGVLLQAVSFTWLSQARSVGCLGSGGRWHIAHELLNSLPAAAMSAALGLSSLSSDEMAKELDSKNAMARAAPQATLTRLESNDG